MNLKQVPPERCGRIGAFLYRIGAERSLAPYYAAVAGAVAGRLPALPPGPVDILDLGCGPGALTRRLAAAGGRPAVIGVDEALTMLGQARRGAPAAAKSRGPGPAGGSASNRGDGAGPDGGGASRPDSSAPLLLAGRVDLLPLPDGVVRLALASLSFHHWEEPEAALAEIHRVLAPGGEMWTLEPDPDFSLESVRRGLRRLLGIWPPLWMMRRAFHQHGFAAGEYAELVAPAVARSPFGAIASVEPFLWLQRMVLRRAARGQAGVMRTPGTSSAGTER